MSGTRTDGERTDLWFRETVCLRKAGGAWKITHEHNSVPTTWTGQAKQPPTFSPDPPSALTRL